MSTHRLKPLAKKDCKVKAPLVRKNVSFDWPEHGQPMIRALGAVLLSAMFTQRPPNPASDPRGFIPYFRRTPKMSQALMVLLLTQGLFMTDSGSCSFSRLCAPPVRGEWHTVYS